MRAIGQRLMSLSKRRGPCTALSVGGKGNSLASFPSRGHICPVYSKTSSFNKSLRSIVVLCEETTLVTSCNMFPESSSERWLQAVIYNIFSEGINGNRLINSSKFLEMLKATEKERNEQADLLKEAISSRGSERLSSCKCGVVRLINLQFHLEFSCRVLSDSRISGRLGTPTSCRE
jgi:hypothetical protein